MGQTYFPDDIILDNYKNLFEFDSHSLIQFYHRILAYLIIFYSLVLSMFIYYKKKKYLYKSINILIFFLFLQISLGICTLISGLNIYLASMHQLTSVLLVFSALNLYFLRCK